MCTGVRVTQITGSGSDEWIYWRLHGTISINYNQDSAIADLPTFKFTFAHALGYSVSTRRLLATDFLTGTITSNNYEGFLSFLLHSSWTADPPILSRQSPWFLTLYSSVLVSHLIFSSASLLLCSFKVASLYRPGTDTHHRKHVTWPLPTIVLWRHWASARCAHVVWQRSRHRPTEITSPCVRTRLLSHRLAMFWANPSQYEAFLEFIYNVLKCNFECKHRTPHLFSALFILYRFAIWIVLDGWMTYV
jgi:hypothetical protein